MAFEGLDLLGGGGQPGQVECDPANQGPPVGGRRRSSFLASSRARMNRSISVTGQLPACTVGSDG